LIQNPLEKIPQHRFDHGWRLAGESVDKTDLPLSKPGMTLTVFDDDGQISEGKIIAISENGHQLALSVRYEDGGPARTVIFSPDYMSVRE
jgi:hypothetical protein